MHKIIVIIVTLLAGGASAEVMALRNVDIGDPSPPFCAKQLGGSEICSSKYKDTILVASFIRLDQKKSEKIMLNLQDLHTRYGAGGVSFIGIFSGDVDRQEVVAFVDKTRITFPLLLDEERDIYGGYGVIAYPTTVVFGRDGKMEYLFGSNTINIRKRVEGCIRFLLDEIEEGELEKIMHPVVEKISPERAKAERYYNFAKNYFGRRQFSKAKKMLESSLERYSEHALSYSLYGYILIEEENYTSCLEQFELALKLDPGLEEAKTGKQVCLDNLNH
ncbi:MAG: redoxin domain-containing protein [Desulfobulbaceae bacterium]|nr:redoxin domain-containing protein [Desulfobulbaceae bacterium]